ncbi:MAG TPA: type IX secretion system membrane protein PorP/SprF [Gammaproteobacteria bacterium]|nr:type IX secretion system membrane protein PorP/SprF [Gammaproteobacteria bacterium]
MRHKIALLAAAPLLLITAEAQALSFGTFDPRSMAMGGTGVAAGTSANAHYYNPALLAAAREGEDFSLELPVIGVRVADPDDLESSLQDFQDARYIEEFSDAVDAFNASSQSFAVKALDPNLGGRVVNAADALVDALPTLSNKALEGDANVGIVVGVPGDTWGVSVSVTGRAVGGGLLFVSPDDIANFKAIIAGLQSGNPAGIVDAANNLIDFADQQVLESKLRGRGAAIAEFGVSVAREFTLGGQDVAFGVTPKYVQVSTFDYEVTVETAEISIDEGKKSYNNINLDLGAASRFDNGWVAGLVIKNLLAKSYTTVNNNEIKIEPQIRAGIAYQWQSAMLAADLDLTKNDSTGFDTPTRFLSVGGEWNIFRLLQLRLGYRYNLEDSDTSSYAAGFGLSPFGVHIDLAAVGNDREIGAGLQLGFRF